MTNTNNFSNTAKIFNVLQVNTGNGYTKKSDPTHLNLIKTAHAHITGVSESNP